MQKVISTIASWFLTRPKMTPGTEDPFVPVHQDTFGVSSQQHLSIMPITGMRLSWQVIGASSLGTSHLRNKLPCQDAHKYQVHDDYVIAAVADGLGSATYSRVGAQLAVDIAVDILQISLLEKTPCNREEWEKMILLAFIHARNSIEEQAQSEGHTVHEYATTLITLVVTPEWLTVGHIGDGAVVAQFEDGLIETVSEPQRGEYANSVMPLTATDVLPHIRLCVRRTTVKSVAMLTDGLQHLSINQATGAPYFPFFAPFFEAIEYKLDSQEASQQLAVFLDSERICARTDDDKTLVVVGRLMAASKEMQSTEESSSIN